MISRLPTASDFPANITLVISPPTNAQPPTNVLLLLHGVGDTHVPFQKLGQQLNLPETVTISVRAHSPLPFDIGGFHWGDDIVFDQATETMEVDTGFEKATKILGESVMKEGLMHNCGFRADEIVIFGLGQGGMAALAAVKSLNMERPSLGGVVSIGGPLPQHSVRSIQGKCSAPVLVCHGSSRSLVTTTAARALRDAFQFVEIHQWPRPGDGMPTNRDEMLPIMQFFARRLRSRRGIPDEAVEVT